MALHLERQDKASIVVNGEKSLPASKDEGFLMVMPNVVLKIDTPTVDKLHLESGNADWDSTSKLKVDPSAAEDRRSSGQLSVVSDESRRQSLFIEDDDKEDAGVDEEKVEDEEWQRKRQDETFIDKARAAMVVIGSKDIKEALERKKAVEISRKTPEAKFSAILFEQAKFLMHQNRFMEALLILNRALTINSLHKEWLTAKSRCYLNLLQPKEALVHVNLVLKHNPKYFQALVLKGEILYSLWDLERSMLCFVEGRRLRPDNTECIQGMHKVKMALEEMAEYRFSKNNRKQQNIKKRSKSAKGRLTSVPPSECFLSPNQGQSPASRRPSTRLSFSPSSISKADTPGITAAASMVKTDSPSLTHSLTSDQVTPPERPQSRNGGRRLSVLERPKTAIPRRKSRSRKKSSEVDEIRRFVKESMSSSYRSSSLRCIDDKSGGHSSQSFSSSMEDASANSETTNHDGTPKLPKSNVSYRNGHQAKCKTTLQTKISVSLGRDKIFLDSLLRDKDLKHAQTAYTRRALKIAREVQTFVTEREKYWRNREGFIRYAIPDEDTLL